ncbi:MAG TPA: molybdopterin dinucleotide binding domain-containing protein, partial [Solirubrobacterales bacterium]|nr:molybdopterin dinucleotide binding domain-containing protein [Solirubrobacterales bacterium]
QRVRPSAGRPGQVRPNIQVLSELSAALGHDTGIDSQPSAFAALTEAVPFYSSIGESEIGGQGIRWQDTPSAANVPSASPTADAGDPSERFAEEEGSTQVAPASAPKIDEVPSEEGSPVAAASLALGTYRDLWAGPITELNPPLKFLTPQQRVELSPADAQRLGLKSGDRVEVASPQSAVTAEVAIKERVQEGVVFLAEGVADGNANALLNGGPVQVQVRKLSEVGA